MYDVCTTHMCHMYRMATLPFRNSIFAKEIYYLFLHPKYPVYRNIEIETF